MRHYASFGSAPCRCSLRQRRSHWQRQRARGGQLFRESIDENEVRVEEDFCGVDGLTVEFATHRSERFMPFRTDRTASSTSVST